MARNSDYECGEGLGGVGGREALGLGTTKSDLVTAGNKALFYSIFGIGIGSMFLLLGLLRRRAKRDFRRAKKQA